ncbi:hypothetical protein HDA40_007254 [Hamadaea flava]|uniref:Uncharacterized protein n=1 Tax=Hamadaea flava TaxID=1742688 RepID=A0ABV8LSV3_9ACTN|nr:hypothetical protein [Hamadaea flava]MCP2328747.1 hypothetical protein [Hamadaea flava]
MSEKEIHDASRETVRTVVDRPQAQGTHEEELLRYLGGVAYREQREESRSKRDVATEENRR